MIKFNLIKNLKFSDKRFKIFILSLFALLILVPFLVFAIGEYDSPEKGYKQLKNNETDLRPVFWNTNNDPNNISTSTYGVCIHNSSANDYFIPTRTQAEFNAFKSAALVLNESMQPKLGLTIIDGNSQLPCIGDGVCNQNGVIDPETGLETGAYVENYYNDPTECADFFQCEVDVLADPRDGKTYNTVTYNNRCWMATNLNYGCSDTNGNCGGYGNLYSYSTALDGQAAAEKVKGICPPEWHIPSNSEFQQLSNFLGGDATAALNIFLSVFNADAVSAA